MEPNAMSIAVSKLGDELLAEVVGVDVKKPLPDEIREQVYRAFLDNVVVVFRDQDMTAAETVRFAGNFGRLEPHITKKYNHPDFEELIVMTNLNEQGKIDPVDSRRGDKWHTDMCYRDVPARATMLHTIEIPEVGGDTLFANMYRALETMPASLRERLEGRKATFRYGGRHTDGQVRLEKQDQLAPLVEHPIVKQHPDTKRCSVFVNPAHTVGIVGMDDAAALELLEETYQWCARPEFQARHKWRQGDTVVWDNRCAWHKATGDNPLRQPRRFFRATIADN
jgi:taurine dioxygenase